MSEDREAQVREKALELLSFREHSRKELFDKLISRRYPRDIVSDVVDRLCRNTIVDDRRFAELFVRSKVMSKPHGRAGLVAMLRLKGLTLEDADAVVERVFAEENMSELDLAWRAVRSAGRMNAVRMNKRELGRMSAMLMRRGFEMDVIREVVEELELVSRNSSGEQEEREPGEEYGA